MTTPTSEAPNSKPYKIRYFLRSDCYSDCEGSCYCDTEAYYHYLWASSYENAEAWFRLENKWREPNIHGVSVQELPWTYLNVYLVDRAFGGHEEGGWWYDIGTCVESVPLLPSMDEDTVLAELQAHYSNEGRNRYSVNSCGEYVFRFEHEKGQDYPAERPHYE